MRWFVTAGLCAACLLVTTAAASARGAAMPGPASFATGLADDRFESLDANVRNTWLSRARGVSSAWVRINVPWFYVAPQRVTNDFRPTNAGDPHYNWGWLDGAVRDAVAQHEKLLLTILQPPRWALGPHAPRGLTFNVWKPDPRALGQFAHALAERYSGRFPDPLAPARRLPAVTYFQAWNEPNLPTSILPQWQRSKHGWVPASAYLYRRMLNAVYTNVKAVQHHAQVLMGALAPYGDPPGVDRMAPVYFLRELLCLHGDRLRREPCAQPAHFDALDIHPYTLRPEKPTTSPLDVAVLDIGRLSKVVRAAAHARRALPAGPKPIWETEINWTTKPPDPNGISAALQARYLSQSFYLLWRQGVSHIFWFLIGDVPYKSETGAGLFYENGTSKPSASAFRFPFVAVRRGTVATIWGRAPTPGLVMIQRKAGDSWHTAFRIRTTKGGVFYRRVGIGRGTGSVARHQVVRALAGRIASVGWSVG